MTINEVKREGPSLLTSNQASPACFPNQSFPRSNLLDNRKPTTIVISSPLCELRSGEAVAEL